MTADRNWDGFARWVSRDGSMGSEMGFCCMVAASQRGRQQDGSFSPLTLSVSLCTTLYSLSLSCLSLLVSPLAFSSFFFNLFFRLFWTTGFVVFFFFFFNIYMGFGLADSVGWFRIFGGGPKLKRKGRPKSSFFSFFFWENLLTIYIFFFFGAQIGPGPL